MSLLWKLISVVFFIMSPLALLKAEIYGYHPLGRMYLGGGHNPFFPTQAYPRCLKDSVVKAVGSSGATTTTMDFSQVKSRQEFHQKIGFSSTLEGSFFFYRRRSFPFRKFRRDFF